MYTGETAGRGAVYYARWMGARGVGVEGAGGRGAPAQLRSDGRHEGGGGALANAPLQPRGVDLKEEKLAPLAVQREPRGVLWGVMWCVLVCGVCTWGVRGRRRVWGWVAVRVCV